MRTLKTSEAAALLEVSPNTLRAWEARFGYPKPRRSRGRHRLYIQAEIEALRQALEEGLSISSAVSAASEAIGADADALSGALASFSDERADNAMESSLQLRSMERSIEEVLLPALHDLRRRRGVGSAAWSFGAAWACDWLRRARRITPPSVTYASVFVGDASGAERDPAGPCLRALELLCERAGARLLSLPVTALEGLPEAAAGAAPNAVVVAGHSAGDEHVARWADVVRTTVGSVPFAVYLRPQTLGLRGARPLADAPGAARNELLALATDAGAVEGLAG
jgi:DNA-binding transcriptional MerR regulator